MVSSSALVKCQLILYFLRLPLLIMNIYCLCFFLSAPPIQINISYGPIFAILICGCVNDFYMFTWNIYTCGSLFAHPILQILISLALVPPLILETILIHQSWQSYIFIGISVPELMGSSMMPWLLGMTALSLINVFILGVTAVFWIQGPSLPWVCGNGNVRWTQIFGTRRPPNDEVQRPVRKAIKKLRHWSKNIIYRRIVDVESTRHATTQNIAALILVLVLVAQSVILIHGVIYEKLEMREVWRASTVHLLDFCNFTLMHEIVTNQTWGLFINIADHAASIVPSTPTTCQDIGQLGISICWPTVRICTRTTQADTLNIAMIANTSNHNSSSSPERIWMIYSSNIIYPEINRLYDHGIHFMPGYQLSGLVTLTERHVIESYFADMWGFKPGYHSVVLTSIDWIQRTPLNNESVAWVTLEFNTPERYYGQDKNYIRVIEDFRQHTFLSALSSIGGLLSVFQGLHILCFGKPLFWGMFGSKLLDPFGIFASGSRALRKRMANRYGYDTESRTFSAEGLSLFLHDFVLDIGPLDKGDDDDDDVRVENENENEDYPSTVGESQDYDAIPLEGVAGDLEDDRCLIHASNT